MQQSTREHSQRDQGETRRMRPCSHRSPCLRSPEQHACKATTLELNNRGEDRVIQDHPSPTDCHKATASLCHSSTRSRTQLCRFRAFFKKYQEKAIAAPKVRSPTPSAQTNPLHVLEELLHNDCRHAFEVSCLRIKRWMLLCLRTHTVAVVMALTFRAGRSARLMSR